MYRPIFLVICCAVLLSLCGCGSDTIGQAAFDYPNNPTSVVCQNKKLYTLENDAELGDSVVAILDTERGLKLKTDCVLRFPYYPFGENMIGVSDNCIRIFDTNRYTLSTLLELPSSQSITDFVPYESLLFVSSTQKDRGGSTAIYDVYQYVSGSLSRLQMPTDISSFYVYGGMLYYIPRDTSGGVRLYQTALPEALFEEKLPSEVQIEPGILVYRTENTIQNLLFSEDEVFVLETFENGSFYDSRLTALNSSRVFEHVIALNIADGYIYYNRADENTQNAAASLYRVRTDGTGTEIFADEDTRFDKVIDCGDGKLILGAAKGYYLADTEMSGSADRIYQTVSATAD